MLISAPLTDAVNFAIARLVDDAQSEKREPSHSDLDFLISKSSLLQGDPKTQGQNVGKTKRIRSVLSWAIENDVASGQKFVMALLAFLQSHGGFRRESPNYCGLDPIANAISTFNAEGFTLTPDGRLFPQVLDNLSGADLTDALLLYVKRAKQGAEDAALLTGTGKDLLEATAAHIIKSRNGSYPVGANFEGLLGMTFAALGLSTPQHPVAQGESAQTKVERSMFSLALSINTMRNKLGTGHGRPWLPNITDTEARAAIQFMGTIAEWLLHAHTRKS